MISAGGPGGGGRRNWNPSYRVEKRTLRIEPIRATERADIVTAPGGGRHGM